MPTGAIVLLILFFVILIGILTKPLWIGEEKGKSYNSIEDFFSIDIHNVGEYGKTLIDEDKDRGIAHYDIYLPNVQMGMFNQIEMIEFANSNSWNLHFIGISSQITKELIDFINFMLEKEGLDQFKKGRFSSNELRNIKIGTFSRVWRMVNIYMEDDVFHILLFDVKQI